MLYEIIVRYPVEPKPHPFVWFLQRNTYELERARQIANDYLRINTECMVLPVGSYARMVK